MFFGFCSLLQCHNSVIGIREYAYRYGGGFRAVNEEDLPSSATFDLSNTESSSSFNPNQTFSLFAFPAEDNFAGVKYPLHWIQDVHNGFFNDVFFPICLHCRARSGSSRWTPPRSSPPTRWTSRKSSRTSSRCLSTRCSGFLPELVRYWCATRWWACWIKCTGAVVRCRWRASCTGSTSSM